MELGITGRTALVTGASVGIGRSIARMLASEGVHVAAAARRVALLESLGDEVKAAGLSGSITPFHYDLLAPGAAKALNDTVSERLGPVDILMNVAGQSRVLDLNAGRDAWEEALALKFWCTRDLTHEVLPAMRSRGWGRVVNLTGQSEPYHLSGSQTGNGATHAWAKSLSCDVGRDGITINSLQPGRVHSEQMSRMYPTKESEVLESEKISIGRFGEPEEVAALAVFLASQSAGYITGTVIATDGGLHRFSF